MIKIKVDSEHSFLIMLLQYNNVIIHLLKEVITILFYKWVHKIKRKRGGRSF